MRVHRISHVVAHDQRVTERSQVWRKVLHRLAGPRIRQGEPEMAVVTGHEHRGLERHRSA
jgi:hypothetical protein